MQLNVINKQKHRIRLEQLNTPLNKAGSLHHNNDAYKHVGHNPLVFDTSFHKPNLDNKGPILNSVHIH